MTTQTNLVSGKGSFFDGRSAERRMVHVEAREDSVLVRDTFDELVAVWPYAELCSEAGGRRFRVPGRHSYLMVMDTPTARCISLEITLSTQEVPRRRRVPFAMAAAGAVIAAGLLGIGMAELPSVTQVATASEAVLAR